MSYKSIQSGAERRIAASAASGKPQPPNGPGVKALEIELKLTGDPGAVEAAFEAIAGGASGPMPRARNLVSTYFDTADRALRDKDRHFRIRKIFRRYVATLKWKQNASNSHVRGELEARLVSPDPAAANLGPELADKLQQAIGDAPLVEQFTTRIRRRTHLVAFNGAQIEVALDIGTIVAQDRRAPVCELELELKKGEIAALYEFAKIIISEHNLRLSQLTKAERGFLCALGEPCGERRSRAPGLSPGASLDEIIEIVVGECLEQFTDNWPALDGAHKTEAVHQMRVGLRRLRTALSLFNRVLPNRHFAYFRSEAKSLASALGAARDTDVFIALVQAGPIARFGADAGFNALLASAAAQREIGYARASAIIGESQASRFVLELRAFLAQRGWRSALEADELLKLNESAASLAERTLKRLDKRALKLGKRLHKREAEDWHELRIELKKSRYAAEFFGDLYGAGKVKKYNRGVAKLQDVLGDYNDAIMANRIVSQLEQLAGPVSSRAAGIVLGWCGRSSFDAEEPLLEAWKVFRDAERFW